MENIKAYKTNKDKYGSFWGLYLTGIDSVACLKYSLSQVLVMLVLGLASSYMSNAILMYDTKKTPDQNSTDIVSNLGVGLLALIAIEKIANSLEKIILHMFEYKICHERTRIAENITSKVNELFLQAPYKWKNQNTNNSQKETIREMFYAYDQMTFMISFVIRTFINTVIFLVISLTTNFVIPLVIVPGSYVIYKLKKHMSTKISEWDKQMGDKMTKLDIEFANQCATRVDIQYNPSYANLCNKNKYDPINGLVTKSDVWDERHIALDKVNTLMDLIRNAVTLVLSAYLWYVGQFRSILFVIVNSHTLFGFLEVKSKLDEVRDLAGSRLVTSFVMFDSLVEVYGDHNKLQCISTSSCTTDDYDEKVCLLIDSSCDLQAVAHNYGINSISQIVINNIHAKISDALSLSYNGTITINKGIVLLNGKKGSGKSVTVDLIAGFYDGHVTDGITINGVHQMPNEFRDLQKNRVYVRQIMDEYKANKKNTVYMSLAELFPNGTLEEIGRFLKEFDLLHKIPKNLDSPVSTNERELSPGETQALVLASQLWKTTVLQKGILLLDEPERNIDFDTVKNIFDKVVLKFDGIIFLITHNDQLKQYIKSYIKQVWNYKPNNCEMGGQLTFTVDKIMSSLI